MLNITSAETLFSGIGISIVALGFLCCLIKKRIRFGILSLLLGNIFLWSAIVFPKKATDLMSQYGIDPAFFEKNELYHGIAAGVVLFTVWYFIRSAFVAFLNRFTRKNDSKQNKSEQSQASDSKKIATLENVSSSDSELNAHESENKRMNSTLERLDPSFGNEEKANPHLFDNLKLNR